MNPDHETHLRSQMNISKWRSEAMQREYGLLLATFVLSLWIVGSVPARDVTGQDENEMTELDTLELFNRGSRLVAKTLHGRFIVSGEVVDEGNNRLRDVQISMRMTQMIGLGWDQKSTYETAMASNGAFRVDVRPYASLNLTFSKDGYHEEQRFFRFRMDVPPKVEEAILAGEEEELKEGVNQNDHLRVIMEKKGEVVSLVEFRDGLTYSLKDQRPSGTVLSFDRAMWDERRTGSGSLRTTVVANLLDKKLFPKNCVYILADEDEEGRIAYETRLRAPGHAKRRFQKTVRVCANNSSDGFLVYEQDNSGNEHAFWSMKRAPANGYMKELVLNADWLFRRSGYRATRGPEAGIYFFFKTNGMYGKGRIGNAEFIEGGHGLKLSVTFQLQLDESRNLNTGRR